MAMTEKQIFKRMNDAYVNEYGDDDFDEWYGDDSPEIWRFYRPSEETEYKMVMDQPNKKINYFYKTKNDEDFHRSGCYSWR